MNSYIAVLKSQSLYVNIVDDSDVYSLIEGVSKRNMINFSKSYCTHIY